MVKLKELKYVREADVSSQIARSELQNKIWFQFYVLFCFSVKDGEVSHENHGVAAQHKREAQMSVDTEVQLL